MSDEETTRILKRKNNTSEDETIAFSGMQANSITTNLEQSRDDDHTKVFRPNKNLKSDSIEGSKQLIGDGFFVEPVVGWLVIVEGPGKGQFLKIGFGMNSIGRNKDERIPLDFGDEEISRERHALISYDPKGNKFYLQHGGGINLTYVGDTPVLQTVELQGRELISIGNTKMVFVQFCGNEFSW
jgi:FHA domain